MVKLKKKATLSLRTVSEVLTESRICQPVSVRWRGKTTESGSDTELRENQLPHSPEKRVKFTAKLSTERRMRLTQLTVNICEGIFANDVTLTSARRLRFYFERMFTFVNGNPHSGMSVVATPH